MANEEYAIRFATIPDSVSIAALSSHLASMNNDTAVPGDTIMLLIDGNERNWYIGPSYHRSNFTQLKICEKCLHFDSKHSFGGEREFAYPTAMLTIVEQVKAYLGTYALSMHHDAS